jgi:signal transduction histidine kinase
MVLYSLLLLATVLGAVWFLVHQTSRESLEQKQKTYRELLQTQYEDRKREQIDKFDERLLFHARALANMAQSHIVVSRAYPLRFVSLGLLSVALHPNGHAAIPLWVAEQTDDALAAFLGMSVATEVQIDESLQILGESFYSQIELRRGRAWRSRALGDRALPSERDQFEQMPMFDWRFDDVDWMGHKLRRVRLKVPVVRVRFQPPEFRIPSTRSADGPRRERVEKSSSSPPPPRINEATPFFIQSAADRSELDRTLAELDAELEQRLEQADAESRESLSRLKRRLLGISLATFVLGGVGIFALVSFGLAPLRRLTEAVSRISETDFRLRYSGPKPPRELAPIVERLTQSLAMLERAFEREKQATADISHELRTPLAGLLTTIEVALRKTRTTEEYRETLLDCRDICRQLNQLVERLLTLTRLDSRADRLRREPVDLGALADQCAAVIRPLARAHGLTLEVEKATDRPVYSDPDKLREVMANLLHNAVEYNRPQGSIHLRVRTTDQAIQIEVEDTGVGIAPDHRERIFERFYRVDSSRNAAGTHAGLGLSIVRGCVELLHGTIRVESEVGKGSLFRVVIPTAPRTDHRQ